MIYNWLWKRFFFSLDFPTQLKTWIICILNMKQRKRSNSIYIYIHKNETSILSYIKTNSPLHAKTKLYVLVPHEMGKEKSILYIYYFWVSETTKQPYWYCNKISQRWQTCFMDSCSSSSLYCHFSFKFVFE